MKHSNNATTYTISSKADIHSKMTKIQKALCNKAHEYKVSFPKNMALKFGKGYYNTV